MTFISVDSLFNEDVKPPEVIEINNAEWIYRPSITPPKSKVPVVECSNCHITFCDLINNHKFAYHYCPWCGSKMEMV